ncbi:MAG: homocysteine S-methyltransferase family protein [Desulfonatronovibrionaceae bacterium]
MNFKELITSSKVLIFDGGMGTLLQSRGLKPGQSPEDLGWQNPEVIQEIHELYSDAGADFITTNTFGGSRFKLSPEMDPVRFNSLMASLAVRAARGRSLVAGSVGPTGQMLAPLGSLEFKDLVLAFQEQIKGLAMGGAHLILGETHFDLAEARAVVIAARQVCQLPVAISMTFEQGQSLTGSSARVFLDSMQNLGVDIISINCSSGPEDFVPLVRDMLPGLRTPLLIQPNAGLPVLENQQTVFKLGPDQFASKMSVFLEMGARLLGGCCGTTPEHTRALAAMAGKSSYRRPEPSEHICPVLTSRTRRVPLGFSNPPVLIGERVNPTGKKELTAQLQRSEFTLAIALAEEQLDQGADVLDVNVGAPMVCEEEVLPALITELTARFDAPLCVDSSNVQAVERSLLNYPGSILVNSISGEKDKMETLGPKCRDFGAPFILLPLKGGNLPATAGERLKIIESLVEKAHDLGIPRHLIVVDALALTISSSPGAGMECLEVIRCCREEWQLPTLMGLSNISFGLPARELINSIFLSMALASGMSGVIANPSAVRIKEAMAASRLILRHDDMAENFIARFSQWKPSDSNLLSSSGQSREDSVSDLHSAIIKGKKEAVIPLLEQALKNGQEPFEIVNSQMIPAINIVGEKYEKREYFLPQLIMSAETMKQGFEFLRPHLEKDKEDLGPTVVMATVEGDIHDIGKNIVCLMLRNYGFHVLDLGKDVSARTIVDTARKHKADVIGLSALMTTTMVRMEETIKLIRKEGLQARVMVGGAVLTPEYADRIQADGYAGDAVSAVKTARKLCEKKTGR